MDHETASPAQEPFTRRPELAPLPKLLLETGPLVLFFAANYTLGIFPATAVLMVGVVAAVALSYALTRRVPVMPLVTAVAVVFFGALTLYFNNDLFIKLKPTIVNALFGTALLCGLWLDRPLLPIVLGGVFKLTREGWRKLTLRWGVFFFVLAALNEIVWRTQSSDFWVSFKVFGTFPLTALFMMMQVPLIMRYEDKSGDVTEPPV